MELDFEKLQRLIERAWDLNEKLNAEIERTISFCRFCSDHGRFCRVTEDQFEEREKLIAIRDSLKDVENILHHVQRLRSWQEIDRRAAIVRLEQSRLFLVKAVTGYQGRELDVVKEVNAFGEWKAKESAKTEEDGDSAGSNKRRISGFLVCCIGILFNPWKWKNTTGLAAKWILISASASIFLGAKQRSRKVVSILDSMESGRINSLLTLSKNPLDVFCGRG